MNLLYIAIACGLVALLYGIVTSRQVLARLARQPAHDRGRRRDPGRRVGLSAPPVHDHRRSSASLSRRSSSSSSARCQRAGFVLGALALGRDRLRRHEHLGPRQRPHRRGRAARPAAGPDHGVPRRRDHRHARRRPGAARDRGLLLLPDRRSPATRPTTASSSTRCRARVRRLADLDLRASRRRHLHQGRRRRRRPGRQGRGRNSRGRPAQPRGDRRQRRRQCRRLRRHGRRPVRDLCRHRRRDDGARPPCW